MTLTSAETSLDVTDVQETANIEAPPIRLEDIEWCNPAERNEEQALGRMFRRLPPLRQTDALSLFNRFWIR